MSAEANTSLSIVLRRDGWPLKQSFDISRGSKTVAETVSVEIWDATRTIRGRGGCVPYARYGETVNSVLAQLGAVSRQLPLAIMPEELAKVLPAGAARNALDTALRELRARQAGVPVWKQLGLTEPLAVRCTDTTISLGSVEAMRAATLQAMNEIAHMTPCLKVKLGGSEHDASLEAARLRAVRDAAPKAELLVDVNEGWDAAILKAMIPTLAETRVMLLEQPLPVGQDDPLRGLQLPCPVFADESLHTRADLPALLGKYQGINIKLDKTGGLTEAMFLRREAEAVGLQIMIGCMVGSSLCMAPAILLAQGDGVIADLDGAALLAQDEQPALKYVGGFVHPPLPALWG